MAISTNQTSFNAGEIAPELFGEVDLKKFTSAASTLRNFVANYRGGAFSRAGTALVGVSLQTTYLREGTSTGPPRLLSFQFSITQGYVLEFGDNYIRPIYQGGYVLENPIAITGALQTSPVTIEVSGTPFNNGDWVYINGVDGMTQINGGTYIVTNVGSGSFQILYLTGAVTHGATFGAYTGGGDVSRLYTISTPYAASDLPYLKFSQSADVMSLTDSNPTASTEYAPYDLTRHTAISWGLVLTDFDSVIAAPASISAASLSLAPSTGINATFSYVVTSVDKNGNESISSTPAECHGADIEVEGGTNVVTFSGVQTATYFNIYRAPPAVDTSGSPNAVPQGSIYGFVGSSYGTQFNDTQSVADLSQTPPTHQNPFAPGRILAVLIDTAGSGLSYGGFTFTINTSTGSSYGGYVVVTNGELGAFVTTEEGARYAQTDTITFSGGGTLPTAHLDVGPDSGTYPGVVAYFQQRRFYANSLNDPDTFWASQTALYNNFDSAIPTQPTDAITASPWTEQVNGIQWLIPMPGGLIAMTGLRAWQIIGEGSYQLNVQPVTPSTTQAQPQAFNGCSATIQPIVIDYDVLYVEAIGNTTVRDLSWNFWVNIYTGADLTILSSHLFLYREIIQWAWARNPYKVLWSCCNDGTMLSLTYLKEQEVYAWARHDTQGIVVSVTSITEPPVNAVYLVVQRFPPNAPSAIYAVERMDNRIWQSVEDAYSVDSGVSNPMVFPNVLLFASATSGSGVEFSAGGAVFSASSVGQVIRMAGGIAVVTSYVSSSVVKGTFVLPAYVGPLLSPYAAAGSWSIAEPVTSLMAPHIAGMTVVGLADGVPIGPFVVGPTGLVTLPFPASDVKVGLSFLPQLQTPYLNGQGVVQGARKVIPAATVRVARSAQFQVGTNQIDGSTLNPPQIGPAWNIGQFNPANSTGGQLPPLTYTTPGGATATQLWTGDLRGITGGSEWNSKGQIAIQQPLPLALEVVSIAPEVLDGDSGERAYSQQEQRPEQARPPGRWMLGGGGPRI